MLQEGQKLRIHVCTVFQSNQRPQKSLAEVITCNLSVKTRKQDITILKKLGSFSSMVSGLMKYNKLKKAAFTSNSSHATCYQYTKATWHSHGTRKIFVRLKNLFNIFALFTWYFEQLDRVVLSEQNTYTFGWSKLMLQPASLFSCFLPF